MTAWSTWSAKCLAGEPKQVGRQVEVMFAAGEGRKDQQTHRMSGRARDGRLVMSRYPRNQKPVHVPVTWPTWSSPTPPRTTSTPTPDLRRCAAPSAATRGKPAGRRRLTLQSILGSLRSAPLVRYSPLKPALRTDEAAEEPLHARRTI